MQKKVRVFTCKQWHVTQIQRTIANTKHTQTRSQQKQTTIQIIVNTHNNQIQTMQNIQRQQPNPNIQQHFRVKEYQH